MKRSLGALISFLLGVIVVAPLPAAAIDGDPGPGCAVDWTAAGKELSREADDGEPTLIVDARAGQQECFDRFVVDMSAGAPRVLVGYVTEFRQAGSGFVVPLRGAARLDVTVFAPAHDGDFNPTYDPPDRNEAVDVSGYQSLRQVYFDATYEAVSAFGLGVRERLPFRVFALPDEGDGARVVIDVAHAWTGSSAPQGASPLGNFESAAGVAAGVQVKGWMLDPDTPNPIYAWVTIDGAGRHLYANASRPDVGAAFPGYGPNHGFGATIPASPGTHRVCVTAANTGPGSHTPLGCRNVTVPSVSPFGNFERATGVLGGIEVKGWMADPSAPLTSLYAWVTIDGVGRHLYANATRPDVAAALPGYGPNHGFGGTIPASPGSHRVCVTAANIGPGNHTPLGCRTVTVPNESPFGNFESARQGIDGIEVKGWMADPSAPTTPIYAWVTIDGVGRHLYANASRPDVGAAYPAYGPNHGFRATIPAPPGTHRVCVTASNVGPGNHTSLGCRTVTFPPAIAVGADPSDVLVVPEAGRAFVANASGGTVSVIDTATNAVTDTIDAGPRPVRLAYDPLTSLLWVGNTGEGPGEPPEPVVVLIDVETLDVVDTIDVDGWGPLLIDPADERAYFHVEGDIDEAVLTVVDTATGDVVATETFPGPWWGVVLDADADLMYVGTWATRQLLVIDLATMTVAAEIDTGFAVSDLSLIPRALDADAGVLYVSEFEGPLHLINTDTLALIVSIPMGSGADAYAGGVIVDDVAGAAYVLKGSAGKIDVVDTTSLTVVDTIEVGGDFHGGALDETTGALYVINDVADTVSVLEMR